MTNSTPNTRDAIRIREIRTADQIPDDLPTPPPDSDSPRWRRSVLALDGDEVVGTGSLALDPVTDTYFCEIDVLESHRRRRIGTQLYGALHALRSQPFPVVARAMRSRPLRRAFAESLGYTVRTHCPAPRVDTATDAVRRWIAQQQLPDGYTTVSMAEQPADKIISAWTTSFVWAHEPFGTVHADQIPLVWEGYSRGVDPHVSMVTLDRANMIVAFSFVSPEVWDGRTMVVSETVKCDQADGVQLQKATVAASLSALADSGIHLVDLEGHSTDPHTPEFFRSLPPGDSDPMDILELEPPDPVR